MKRILIFLIALPVVTGMMATRAHAQLVTQQQYNDSLYKYMTGPQIDTCDSCISNQSEGLLFKLLENKLYNVDSLVQAIPASGADSVGIGTPLPGTHPRDVLFVGADSALQQDNSFFYDGANVNVQNGGMALGSGGNVTGSVQLTGATTGAVTMQPADSTGTWTFYLPKTAGATGQVLTTNGTVTAWNNAPLTSLSDSEGSITVSPATGNASISMNMNHVNTWTSLQIYNAGLSTGPLAHINLTSQTTNLPVSLFASTDPATVGWYFRFPPNSGSMHFTMFTDGLGNTNWGLDTLTKDVYGILPIANGGTNATVTPTAGAVAYGTGSAYGFTAAGTSGQVLASSGTAMPTWTTLTTATTAAWNANELQGVPVSTATPTTSQVLTYNGAAWAPATGGGGGASGLTAVTAVDSTTRHETFFNNGISVRGADTIGYSDNTSFQTMGSYIWSYYYGSGHNLKMDFTSGRFFHNNTGIASDLDYGRYADFNNDLSFSGYDRILYDNTGGTLVNWATPGSFAVSGNISLLNAGNKLVIKSGTNSAIGATTLSGGAGTVVSTTAVTANSLIYLTHQNCVNCGIPYISARTAGVSFKISSTNVADSSSIGWIIVDKQ